MDRRGAGVGASRGGGETGGVEPACAGRDQHGFSLIEVLMAMVILAIGLMGLAGLSVHAVRSLAGADVRSQFAIAATSDLELALRTVHNGQVPQSSCSVLAPFNDRVSRAVDVASEPNVARVTVTVSPGAGRTLPLQPFLVSRSVFTPTLLSGSDHGAPCP